MSAITQCPQCSTRFKVTQAQLDAHEGMVRCGLCQTIFNARERLGDDEPSPQLSLPIMQEDQQQEHWETHEEESASRPAPPPAEPVEFVKFDEFVESIESAEPTEPAEAIELAEPIKPVKTEAATTLAEQVVVSDERLHSTHKPAPKKRAWPWAIGSLLLLVLLLAQAAYYFRIDLAARLPGLKPALQAYCQLLACSIPLPKKPDLVSIESSDMEADPPPATTITLNAMLRNRAPYAQGYPNLELTLTDAQDRALARRSFRPSEYLKSGEDEASGIPPRREANLKLYFDIADLKPAGYRLFLFYP